LGAGGIVKPERSQKNHPSIKTTGSKKPHEVGIYRRNIPEALRGCGTGANAFATKPCRIHAKKGVTLQVDDEL